MAYTYALIDATYLCNRAWKSTGHLQYEGESTGVAFGVFNTIQQVRNLYDPLVFVFAFDAHGIPTKRHEVYPNYKSSRRERYENETDEEKENRRLFYEQVDKIRRELLPEMGYRNIFRIPGYEADDVIAWFAEKIHSSENALIVSRDGDLFQCLSSNVRYYNPVKGAIVTADSFRAEWGIQPYQWADVKAFAGCGTDDIEGIRGIGEKTAAKYIRGELKKGKKYDAIVEGIDIYNRNRPLVSLPWEGLDDYLPHPEQLPDDVVTVQRINDVYDSLGIQRNEPVHAREGFF